MTNLQERHSNMSKTTRDCLIQNSAIVSALPNYETTFILFQNTIFEIDRVAELQEFDKTGISKNKQKLRDSLVIQAIDISRKVVAYATFVDNAILLQEINYTESDLRKSSDEGLKNKTQVIFDRANIHLADLAVYGVTDQVLMTLGMSISLYNSSISKPRLGITEKKQATEQLVVLFETLDNCLKKLDVLVETLRISQPNFYVGYTESRMIVETGKGYIALKALTTEGDTNEPVKGVTFTFVPDATLMKGAKGNGHGDIVKQTADKGMFYIKNMLEGTYNVSVHKPGYKDKFVTASVADGDMTELHVKMEKL